jgi:hypothetical protein
MSYIVSVLETNYGTLTFDSREEAQEFIDDPVDLDTIRWHQTEAEFGQIIDTEAPEPEEEEAPRKTDQELIEAIAHELWPNEEPDRPWTPDTIGWIDSLIRMERPELVPTEPEAKVARAYPTRVLCKADMAHELQLRSELKAMVDVVISEGRYKASVIGRPLPPSLSSGYQLVWAQVHHDKGGEYFVLHGIRERVSTDP